MIPEVETEGLEFGSEEDFRRRSNEFFRLERITEICSNFWFCIVSTWDCIYTNLFIKHCIATTVLFTNTSVFIAAFIVSSGLEKLTVVIYCFCVFVCYIISLVFDKGGAAFECSCEESEQQDQSLLKFEEVQNVSQNSNDAEKDEQQLLNKALKNLMEPKQEKETTSKGGRAIQVPVDFHHPDSYIPPNYRGNSCAKPSDASNSFPFMKFEFDDSAGPSHAPDPFPTLNYDFDNSAGPSHASDSCLTLSYDFDKSARPSYTPDLFPTLNRNKDSCIKGSCAPVTFLPDASVATETTCDIPLDDVTYVFSAAHSDDDTLEFEECPPRLSLARISSEAIEAFGVPVHILGADSYAVFPSRYEDSNFDQPAQSLGSSAVLEAHAEEKTFEASDEIPNSDSQSLNDGSSSAELALTPTEESTRMVASDSYCNLFHVDGDQSSESSSGNLLDEAKNEESTTDRR